MSRGTWDYRDEKLKEEIFGFTDIPNGDIAEVEDKIPNIFMDKEVSELIHDVFALLYAYDSQNCGDWSIENYLNVLTQFKLKWLGRDDARVKYFIDKAIDEVKKELYNTYGLIKI